MKKNYQSFLKYIKKPDTLSMVLTRSGKFRMLWQILILDVALVFLYSLIVLIPLEYFGWINDTDSKFKPEEFSISIVILMAVVIAPLLEELIFRWPLLYRRNYLYRVIASIARLFVRFDKKEQFSYDARSYYHSGFPYFFYGMAILFAFVHITNFHLEMRILLLSPLIVLPQFIGGMFLGYVRVRLGIWWSVLLHAMHNSVYIMFLVISQYMIKP